MNFAKELKRCQYERHMSNESFSKYLGKSRTWLQNIYSKNPNIPKSLLRERTMFEINEKLGIAEELMEEYNNELIEKKLVESEIE